MTSSPLMFVSAHAVTGERMDGFSLNLVSTLSHWCPSKIQPLASSSRRGVTSLDGERGSSPPKPRCEESCRGLHGNGMVIAVSYLIPLRYRATPRRINAFTLWGSAGGDFCSPVLVEHENKNVMAEVMQRSSLTQSLHLLDNYSQQGVSRSAYHLRELTVSVNPGKQKRQLEARAHQLWETYQRSSLIQSPFESWSFSAGTFWHTTLGSWQYQYQPTQGSWEDNRGQRLTSWETYLYCLQR
jgi:hypothetical protein